MSEFSTKHKGMIDTWFKKDLEKIYGTHQIVVFIDESNEVEEVKNIALLQNKGMLSYEVLN